LVACGAAAPAPHTQPIAHAKPVTIETIPSAFWEETALASVTLPNATYERDKLVRPELAARFDALPRESRDKLTERGVLVVPRVDHETSIGDAYVALAKAHVPFVITLDALFSISLRAIDRALDDVDREVVAPALAAALAETEARLAAENHAARSDTAQSYTLARAVIAVARKLADPRTDVDGALADVIAPELTLIAAHAGPAKSPLFGRVIDYGAFDTQAGLAFGDARLGLFRSAAWLARAPFALAPEPSARGLDVAMVRTQTRAAMLLSRATSEAWKRAKDAIAFATGRGDDPGARALLVAADALHFDLRDEATIGNVVRVDKLRAEMLRAAGSTIEDTGGSLATFRLLSPSAPPDVRGLARVMKSTHDLPSSLVVGVVLGAPDARTLLDADHVDDAMLVDLGHSFHADHPTRHATLYASALDAIATYLAPSALDARRSWRASTAYERRKLEVALGAWTELRHASIPFARTSPRVALDEPLVAFDDVPAAIEPHAEAIARLVSLVRQAEHNDAASETRVSSQTLARVEALLKSALSIVVAQSVGPLAPSLAHELAAMPSRIAALERRLGPTAAPLVVATAAQLESNRVVEQSTGDVEDAWLAVDVAGTASIYVGVALPFYESITTLRSTDSSFAKRLAESPPAHPAWRE
jgi:hypothetical protein